MASTRLDILKSMVEQNPRDSFARYGLAMEYRNAGDLEAAMREFRALMAVESGLFGSLFPRGADAGAAGPAGRSARRCTGRVSKRPRARAICTRASELQARWICWGSEACTIVKFGPWRSLASALAWGARGPEFKSRRPDQPFH